MDIKPENRKDYILDIVCEKTNGRLTVFGSPPDFNVRAACREMGRLGRPLTQAELHSFRKTARQ